MTKKTIIKALKKEPKLLINFRLTREEKQLFEEKAKKFADGNLTAFIKFALKQYIPSKKDLITEFTD